jgi:hypothetical protein
MVFCHQCNRGGNGNDKDLCSAGWRNIKPSPLGCVLGAPIVGEPKKHPKVPIAKERYQMNNLTFLCGPRIYTFEGWTFEDADYSGPWPLKKNGELRERAGRKFYQAWGRFDKLPKAKKEKLRLGGGCKVIKLGR